MKDPRVTLIPTTEIYKHLEELLLNVASKLTVESVSDKVIYLSEETFKVISEIVLENTDKLQIVVTDEKADRGQFFSLYGVTYKPKNKDGIHRDSIKDFKDIREQLCKIK